MQASVLDHPHGYAEPSTVFDDTWEPFSACIASGIVQADRERWLRARQLGLGGSEVAALFGLHPYKSALEVYADKIEAAPANDTTSEVALWGQLFEAPILAEYARRSGRHIVLSNQLFIRKDRPWHRCTPDAIQLSLPPAGAEGPGIGECKMTGYGDWNEEMPAHVQVQVQHEMWVTEAQWGTLIWLPVPERKLQHRDYFPHAEFQALLAETVDAFWTRVVERRPPDADGSESSKRALYRLDPSLMDECVELGDGALEVADELERINLSLKQLEARKELIGQRVIQTLGPYKIGLLEDGRYWTSWTTEPRQESCVCGRVHRTVAGFRASRLLPPRKKPHGVAREFRSLSLAPEGELEQLLRATLEKRS